MIFDNSKKKEKENEIKNYILFLRDIIENNNSPYKQILQDVLNEAKKTHQERNYFSVNTERFDIILMLSEMEDISIMDINNENNLIQLIEFLKNKDVVF